MCARSSSVQDVNDWSVQHSVLWFWMFNLRDIRPAHLRTIHEADPVSWSMCHDLVSCALLTKVIWSGTGLLRAYPTCSAVKSVTCPKLWYLYIVVGDFLSGLAVFCERVPHVWLLCCCVRMQRSSMDTMRGECAKANRWRLPSNLVYTMTLRFVSSQKLFCLCRLHFVGRILPAVNDDLIKAGIKRSGVRSIVKSLSDLACVW